MHIFCLILFKIMFNVPKQLFLSTITLIVRNILPSSCFTFTVILQFFCLYILPRQLEENKKKLVEWLTKYDSWIVLFARNKNGHHCYRLCDGYLGMSLSPSYHYFMTVYFWYENDSVLYNYCFDVCSFVWYIDTLMIHCSCGNNITRFRDGTVMITMAYVCMPPIFSSKFKTWNYYEKSTKIAGYMLWAETMA